MTQEELDALMAGDINESELSSEEEPSKKDKSTLNEISADDYRVSADAEWPPPPPTNEHKVVHQLDEVTEESEEKAGEIFDILESIGNDVMEIEESGNDVVKVLESAKETFSKLNEQFPNIETFSQKIEKIDEAIEKSNQTIEKAQNINDNTLTAMDVMQYQDIHRQKIERVINVMRALSRYMSLLFEAQKDDENRVSSAAHIVGDTTEDVVSEDDIEALIASFGK